MKLARVFSYFILLTTVGLSNPGWSSNQLPDLILANNPGMHPEGIEWDDNSQRFLVGSLTMGSVFAVDDDGTVTPFVESDNLSAGSVGIHIDKYSNRLLVAHSNLFSLIDPQVPSFAQLGIYDLYTGEELNFVDMTGLFPGGSYFANDVTTDYFGNAYVTDFLSPVIYKVDSDGNAEVFVEFDDPGILTNGIEFHPHGYLLAAAPGIASLYKIPLHNPSSYSLVELSEPAALDGIVFTRRRDLVGVAPTFATGEPVFEAVVLHSEDNWETAELVSRDEPIAESSPTTVALRDGEAYVVHANFIGLLTGQLIEEFEILRMDDLETDGRVTICYRDRTRRVSLFAWTRFFKERGATLGACP